MNLEKKLIDDCIQKNLTFSLAESCTGGYLSSLITQIPNASQCFMGAIISYTPFVKEKLLHVSSNTIDTYGIVSEEVALKMAQGCLKQCQSDLAFATTGVAGPTGGSSQIPIGTVCMALVNKETNTTFRFQFQGNRNDIIKQASLKALQLMLNHVKSPFNFP